MDFIEIIKAIFFGIVEGITEWLPISSTGHLILLERFIKMNVSEDFMNMFRVVIQLGAIMAVVVIYWKQIWFVDFHGFKSKPTFKKDILNLWGKILVACINRECCGYYLQAGAVNRCISVNCRNFPGYIPFGSNHRRCIAPWCIQSGCGGFYIFPGHSGYVWRKSFKDCKIWLGI